MVSGENALPVPRNNRAAIAQQSAVPSAAKTPIKHLKKACKKKSGYANASPCCGKLNLLPQKHKSTKAQKTKIKRQGASLKYNLNTNSADKTFNVNVTV
jgi:hypothetical protein